MNPSASSIFTTVPTTGPQGRVPTSDVSPSPSRPRHTLQPLLDYKKDPSFPTILCGDFNTHCRLWSLPRATPSPWAARLEDWFDDNNFLVMNPPGIPTWHSQQDHFPSVLDLVLY